MRWWEEPASARPLPVGAAGARAARERVSPIFFLAVLLLLGWVLAQTLIDYSAPDASVASPILTDATAAPDSSSAPLRLTPLPETCTPFWKAGWATPYALATFSGTVIYDPTVHQTVLSMGIDNWTPGSTDGARAVLPPAAPSSSGLSRTPNAGLADIGKAQEQAVRAQMLAVNESQLYDQYSMEWYSHFGNNPIAAIFAKIDASIPLDFSLRIYDTLTPKGVLGIPLRVRPGVTLNDIIHLVPNSVTYAHTWQATMQAGAGALSSGAHGVNAVFAQAQAEADTLHAMGAGDPAYRGGAKGAYENWQSFVVQSARWSDSGQPLADGTASEQRYGRAYHSLQIMQSTCAHPGELPDFGADANLTSTFNDLAGNGDATLWADAWGQYGALRAAYAQMKIELDDNLTQAKTAKASATAALAQLRNAGPGNFSADLPPSSETGLEPAQPSDITGTIPEQAAVADGLMRQAEGELTLGQHWSDATSRADYQLASFSPASDSPGWASLALLHEHAAAVYYAQSQAVSDNSLMQMQDKVGQARARAEDQLQFLQSELAARLSSAPTGAAAAAQTRERAILSKASTKISEADAARGLGKQYADYLQALALLDDAQAVSSNPQSSSDAYALNQTLATYKTMLKAGPGLNVDVSESQAGFDDFYSALLNGSIIPGSADLVAVQVQSLRVQLRASLTDEEGQYQALLSTAQALTPYAPNQAPALTAAFAPYRSADGWSDYALEKPGPLHVLLSKWQSQSDALVSKSVADTLCRNAQWEPAVLRPVAGARLDAGGTWSSANTLGIGSNQSLSVDCPFSHPFLPSDETGTSDNVRSATTSGGKLHLLLSSLDAGAGVEVKYSSAQVPFQLTQKSCQLVVDEQGNLDWQANYSLHADYPASHLIMDVPWPSDSAGASTLAWQGQDLPGQWSRSLASDNQSPSDSSYPQVQFMLSSVPAGTQSFSVHIAPTMLAALNVSSAQATPSTDGSMAVSYQLSMNGLPACSEAFVRRADGASGSLSKISVLSSDASVQAPASSSPDGRWHFVIHGVPPSGSLSVQARYVTTDASTWFNTTLSELGAQALALNDSAAQGQLVQAQSLYQSGSTGPAYALARAVEARLLGETGDGGQSARDWDAEAGAANQSIDALQSLGQKLSAGASRPPWSASLPSWTDELSAARDAASVEASAGHFEQARSAWRKAKSSFEQKALTAAQADYQKLSDQLAAASALEAQAGATGAEGGPAGNLSPSSSDAPSALSNASVLLSATRSALQLSDAPLALSSLADAHQSIDPYGISALAHAQVAAREQQQQAADLQVQSNATAEALQTYLHSLSSLTAAGPSAFRPPLTAAQARTLLAQAQKAAPDPATFADPAGWTDAAKASALLSKQAGILSKANQTLWDARAQAASASQSIQTAAENLARMAGASVAQARQSLEQAGAPPDAANATLSSLDSDLSRLDELMSASQYADAVVLGQSIVTRAKPLITPPTPASSPPWLLIGLTLLLLAGVAYVVMFRKPGEKKPMAVEGAKKLERV